MLIQSIKVFSVFLLFLFCPVGCDATDCGSAKSLLRTYLSERADWKVVDNSWDSTTYQQMLKRLESSNERYIYLHHERAGKAIVVYWFGVDEKLEEIRLIKSDGTNLTSSVEDYREENRKYILSGEPQYYSVILESEAIAMSVVDVQLVQPNAGK